MRFVPDFLTPPSFHLKLLRTDEEGQWYSRGRHQQPVVHPDIKRALIPLSCLGYILAIYIVDTRSCQDERIHVSAVSGYYGPGNYIAWVISMICLLASCECNTAIANSWGIFKRTLLRTKLLTPTHNREEAINRNTKPVDLSFLALLAYPLIACCDALRRIYIGQNYWEPLDRAHLNATLSVVHTAQILAVFAVIGEWYHRDLDRTTTSTHASRNRVQLWTHLWGVCLVALDQNTDVPIDGIRWSHLILTSIFWIVVFPITARVASNPNLGETRGDATAAVTGIMVMLTVTSEAMHIVSHLDCNPLRPKVLGIPRSGVGLKELDQAAVLGTTICLTLYSTLRFYIRGRIMSTLNKTTIEQDENVPLQDLAVTDSSNHVQASLRQTQGNSPTIGTSVIRGRRNVPHNSVLRIASRCNR